jgi:ABC-2 type transport system permease protein
MSSMFLHIAGFELKKRARMLSTYVYFAVLFGCGLLSMMAAGGAFSSISVGLGSDKVYANAPEILHAFTALLSHFGLPITAAVFGQAVYQDVEAQVEPLFFTTGVGRASYLAGRFLGALVLVVCVFSSIGLGLWVGSSLPFLERSAFGPSHASSYLWPYLVSVLPNLLFTGAIFFSVAALARSMTPVYVGAVVLLVGYLVTQSFESRPENRVLAALIDPFGLRATDHITRYWTVAERNSRLIPFEGVLAQNRALWLALGLALLAFTFRRYRFEAAPGGSRRSQRARTAPSLETESLAPSAAVALPKVSPRGSSSVVMLASLTALSFRETVKSVYFGVIVLAGALFLGVSASQLNAIYGTPTYPVTRMLIEVLGGSFFPFVLSIVAFYSGELTFRERDARTDAIMDALPLPDWLPFVSKLLSLMLVPVVLQGVVLLECLGLQLVKGYHQHELGLYVSTLFGVDLIGYLQMCVLCLGVHGLVQNKYLGHFVIVVYYLARMFLRKLGLEQNLYLYGGTPGHPYSDMNGFGHLMHGVRWFQSYWSLAAVLIAVGTYLMWQRGSEGSLRSRWRRARERLSRPLAGFTGAIAVAFVAVGAFVYYDTNILNHYETDRDREQKRAEYEQRYKSLQARAQPRVTDVNVAVDVFPETEPPSIRVRGTYVLTNRSAEAIPSVYVNLSTDFPFDELRVGDLKAPSQRDERLRFYTFDLARPLGPGEATQFVFDLPFRPTGFTNGVPWLAAVENGSFFSSFEEMPVLGYQPDRELALDNERKKYRLQPRELLPLPSDLHARMNNYVSNDADWVNFRASVSTAPDQIAVAPGYLQREWLEAGRRHFEYAMDSPMLHFFAVLSARYQVRRDRWRDVALEIYYQPGHEYNLDRMMQGMKDTLEYCTAEFGPYQFRQVRILEFPRYETFAESFPNTIPYSEAIGFIAKVDPDDPKDVDYPYYITAHEVAHQWWAHQAIGGRVKGSTFLSESMAQYTALMVMKRSFGPQQMNRFLRYELELYLRGRGEERRKELPLSLVEDQDYIYYRKGSLALYALQDYIGEDHVNRAAHTFLGAVKFQQPPYTTSLELLGHIRAETPPELSYLVDDLFDNITLFDNRAKSARYHRRADGRYELRLALSAHKRRADELGNEREQPISDLIEVGAVDEQGVAVALDKRWFKENETELTMVLDAAPIRAGIDPLNKLVDRDPDDNVVAAVADDEVSGEPAPPAGDAVR